MRDVKQMKGGRVRTQESPNMLKNRAFELSMSVKNVLESRRSGMLSDTKVSEIFFDLAERNQDLVLQEQEDREVREMMRTCRIMLLPFSNRPFI
jgi:hypothetical protein